MSCTGSGHHGRTGLCATSVLEPDVGARVVYQPQVYQERYVAPVYNAYAYQPVVTAPTVAIGPTQRTVVSRTIIPQRHGRAPIVKERIVSETYGRRPEVVDYAPARPPPLMHTRRHLRPRLMRTRRTPP